MIENIETKTNEELVGLTGETVVGTPSGLKAQQAQAELIRRLMMSIEKLDRTTSAYSKILIWLTIVLGALAVIQIVLFLIKS